MSEPQISMDPSQRGNANLIYILYLVSAVIGITAVIGVIMAYLGKDTAAPDWLKSHYRNQINIFWKALFYFIVSGLLTVVLIGAVLLVVAVVWYIVRIIKGMQALSRGEAIENPASWGF